MEGQGGGQSAWEAGTTYVKASKRRAKRWIGNIFDFSNLVVKNGGDVKFRLESRLVEFLVTVTWNSKIKKRTQQIRRVISFGFWLWGRKR